MMNTAGLSLEQAPPISIPFRFFLTAGLFGVAASVLFLFVGESFLVTRWSPITLGMTHAFTIGVLAMVMCGAMTQMLPVLAGSPLPGVVWVGTLVHLLISMGTLLLVYGFVRSEHGILLWGVVVLAIGFAVFIVSVGIALARVQKPSPTIVAMRLAVLSLLVTMFLGVLIGTGILGGLGFGTLATLVDIHLGWGLLGWVGILAVGVSYQIVPMFMVTPEYPESMRRLLTAGVLVALVLWSLLKISAYAGITPGILTTVCFALIGSGFVYYSIVTLRIQSQRKRKVPDVSLLFWRISMVALMCAFVLWLCAQFTSIISQSPRYPLALGAIMILGVAGSLINGMLYKIVPFLSWFHLQNRQMQLMSFSVQIPNMKEFVPDRSAKRHYYAYFLALLLSLLAIIRPSWFAQPAALLLVISYLMLLYNLTLAMIRYRNTRHKLAADPAQDQV